MSLISKKSLLKRMRHSKETRAKIVAGNLSEGIAFQISATREKRGWTQAQLARESGMSQNNLSRLESPDYGKQTISSLKRIAAALDVALVVRMVPFSQYVDWITGTTHIDMGLRPDALAVPNFDDEDSKNVFAVSHKYWAVTQGTVGKLEKPTPVAATPQAPYRFDRARYGRSLIEEKMPVRSQAFPSNSTDERLYGKQYG